MGYIYKIQNLINGHIYIGQTQKHYTKRFQQHKANYDKPYFSHLAIYKAFSKYGLENFLFEPIEEVENELLDEREIFWISHYNSYKNGYNSTIGGKPIKVFEYDLDEIIKLYNENKSARKVAKIIGCDHSTIDHILNANHVPRFTMGQRFDKKTIITKDNEIFQVFDSTLEAAQWLIDNGYSKAKNIKGVRANINKAVSTDTLYLGFKFYYESKI